MKFVWLSGILLGGLFSYGLWIEPNRIELTRHVIGNHVGHPIKRVQLSDLHLVEIDEPVKKVLDAVLTIKPDVIVLSGDVVDRADSLINLDVFLGSLGKMPKVAVLGNWEYWSKIDRKALADLYARHNTTLLVDDCAQIRLQGRQIVFVGMDDALAGKPDYKRVEARCIVDARATVLIEHSPRFFGKPLSTPAANPPVLFNLSGHAHGGQIAVFGHAISNPPGSGAYTSGWYDSKYGPLYVSRGIGMSEIPMRLGARPEIALFEI